MQESRLTVTATDAIVAEYFTRFWRQRMEAGSIALLIAAHAKKAAKLAAMVGRKGYYPPINAVMFFPIEDRVALVAEYRRKSARLARKAITRIAWSARCGRSPTRPGAGLVDVRTAKLDEIAGWRVAAHRRMEGARHFRDLADRIEKLQAPAHQGRA